MQQHHRQMYHPVWHFGKWFKKIHVHSLLLGPLRSYYSLFHTLALEARQSDFDVCCLVPAGFPAIVLTFRTSRGLILRPRRSNHAATPIPPERFAATSILGREPKEHCDSTHCQFDSRQTFSRSSRRPLAEWPTFWAHVQVRS